MVKTEDVKTALIEVVRSIQSDSGYAEVPITGSTCPLRELEGFDSYICTVSITELSTAIGVEIPSNVNIFVSKDGRQLHTVDEAAKVVCRIANKKS